MRHEKRRQSGQVAALTLIGTRVRVKIAGRAHRGKFTPKLGIIPQGINVKKNQSLGEYFLKFFKKMLWNVPCTAAVLLPGLEKHVGGRLTPLFAVVQVEDKIVFQDVVGVRKP